MSLSTATGRASSMLDPGQFPWPTDGSVDAQDRGAMLEFFSETSSSSSSLMSSPAWTVTIPATPTLAVVVPGSAAWAAEVPDHDDAWRVVIP